MDNLIVLCLILDSRQNLDDEQPFYRFIVLCLILDSRQNRPSFGVKVDLIVLCLILDSRQNQMRRMLLEIQLYCALFWIQGKTSNCFLFCMTKLYCALFWIQGKTIGKVIINAFPLYCALFWIQGKTKAIEMYKAGNCTVPYFGFKAKLFFYSSH